MQPQSVNELTAERDKEEPFGEGKTNLVCRGIFIREEGDSENLPGTFLSLSASIAFTDKEKSKAFLLSNK